MDEVKGTGPAHVALPVINIQMISDSQHPLSWKISNEYLNVGIDAVDMTQESCNRRRLGISPILWCQYSLYIFLSPILFAGHDEEGERKA